MKLDHLLSEVEKRHKERSTAPMGERFRDMVHGWLVGGSSVAAIFSSDGKFIQVTQSEYEAKARAVGMRNDNMNVKIKRVTL